MSRNLLAQHKLDAFAAYCEKLGMQVDRAPKGTFQKLGVRYRGGWLYVYCQLNTTVHYTVDHRMEFLVRDFIRDQREFETASQAYVGHRKEVDNDPPF